MKRAYIRDVKQRILLVEDDHQLRAALAKHFAKEGFTVDCAGEREEAEALMSCVDYTLLITDLGLTPFGLNGFDVLESTRDRYPRPKIVVLTGKGNAAVESEAKFRGVDVFLTKPQSLKSISEIVGKLLGRFND